MGCAVSEETEIVGYHWFSLSSTMSRPVPPLLLEAFPAPPTFIPRSPLSPAFPDNPPPSRPPAAPLPPVPGPSRISETETLLFLGSSRSRRSSKLSLRDPANRDSFASTRSDSLLSVSTGSQRSSPRTPSSAAQSLHRPSLAFSIDEHAESKDDLLEGAPLHDLQKAPLDEDDTAEVPKVMPSSSARTVRTPPRTAPRESIAISSIAMPGPDNDDGGPDFDALEEDVPDPRAPSPDIATILATTPRPRLSSLAHRHQSEPDEPWEEDFIDDYGQDPASYAFGYPELDQVDVPSVEGPQLVWDDPEDSDSDLDLHTSLPQVMLQHGFLSPRSKLLPAANAADSASLAPSPVSSVFAASDAPPRDTRDTPKRRLLAGGIGLTTGLGWSDSEDEDAPSALTRRVSSLNLNRSVLGLSRASSQTSLSRTSRASSLSLATFSSRPSSRVRRTQSEHDTEPEVDEFGTWSTARGNPPPTSWARRSEPRLSRAQNQSRVMRTPSTRTDGSRDSLHTAHSASTQASAMSLPLMRSRSRVLRVMMADKEKPLPRTPLGSIRRTPSSAGVNGIRARAATGVNASDVPRARAEPELSMQSTPHPGQSSSIPPPPTSIPGSSIPHTAKPQMRPLRLQPRAPVLGGDRAPVPVPTCASQQYELLDCVFYPPLPPSRGCPPRVPRPPYPSCRPSASSSLLPPSSAASASLGYMRTPYVRVPGTPPTPTTPMYDQPQPEASGIARPRPRTGTGMVYRTSTYSGGIGVGVGAGAAARRPPGKALAL
ncbi:hypothetical protein B0H11DRAFT_1982577 [Mycena galericulata]|nr:hypothetical protein B0H11DRAFT_1982577 [Mycena galericulata]